MIDIYTNKSDSKNWIFQNDLYFNLNTGNEEMTQSEIDLIQQIDDAKLTPDKHIETKIWFRVQSVIYRQAARHYLIL